MTISPARLLEGRLSHKVAPITRAAARLAACWGKAAVAGSDHHVAGQHQLDAHGEANALHGVHQRFLAARIAQVHPLVPMLRTACIGGLSMLITYGAGHLLHP